MDGVHHWLTPHLSHWAGSGVSCTIRPKNEAFANGIWIAFVLVQALDGAMTFVGIHTFGTRVEANPLLSWYVSALGPATALWSAKLFAVACGAALHLTARFGMLAALALLYLLAAVGPWIHLFWRHAS